MFICCSDVEVNERKKLLISTRNKNPQHVANSSVALRSASPAGGHTTRNSNKKKISISLQGGLLVGGAEVCVACVCRR